MGGADSWCAALGGSGVELWPVDRGDTEGGATPTEEMEGAQSRSKWTCRGWQGSVNRGTPIGRHYHALNHKLSIYA